MGAVGDPPAVAARIRPHGGFWTRSPALCRRAAGWFEAGLDAAALVFLPLLVAAPRGAAALASAAGLAAAGLVLTSRDAGWRAVLRAALTMPAGLLGALLAWGLASAIWAPEPWRSVEVAARLAGLFAAGLALAGAAEVVAAPGRLALSFLAGFALSMMLAIGDLASRGMLNPLFSTRPYYAFWLNQASVAFAILLLPSIAILKRGQPLAGLLFGAAGVASVCLLAGTAAKAALTAGMVMAVLVYCYRRRVAGIAALGSVLVIVTAPLTFARIERLPAFSDLAMAVKQSAEHRLLIWSFVGDRIAEHPVAGWGLDASRSIPGGKDLVQHGETWLPLHPHNAPLQLWLELGAPGAALFALLAASIWRALGVAAWPRGFAAAAGGALAAGSVASLATYGIWQEWWLGTLLFSIFLVLVMARTVLPPDDGAASAGIAPGAS